MRIEKKKLRMRIKIYLNGVENGIMNQFSVPNFDLPRTRRGKY